MRNTKQKNIINEEINSCSTFFNAEELHNKITRKNSNIGLATVYRSLKTLEEQGVIHSYLSDNRKIYSREGKKHVHFSCEVCGLKKHITLKKMDFLKEIQEEVCHLQIDIVGICKECSRRK